VLTYGRRYSLRESNFYLIPMSQHSSPQSSSATYPEGAEQVSSVGQHTCSRSETYDGLAPVGQIGRFSQLSHEVLTTGLSNFHPARAFVIRETLNEALHKDLVHGDERSFVTQAFFRLQSFSTSAIPYLISDIQRGAYSRNDLRMALYHPLISPQAVESFFSSVVDRRIFVRSQSERVEDPEVPSTSFGYVSFSPHSMVCALNEHEAIHSFHDLGCGLGSMMFIVALLTDAQVSGTDISGSMCAQGREFSKFIARPDITFHQADLLDPSYTFPPAEVYYSYSPFIWKQVGMREFALKVEQALVPQKGELWLGDYKPLCEVFEEATCFELTRRHDRLSIYR